jgi:hypothetical protein
MSTLHVCSVKLLDISPSQQEDSVSGSCIACLGLTQIVRHIMGH